MAQQLQINASLSLATPYFHSFSNHKDIQIVFSCKRRPCMRLACSSSENKNGGQNSNYVVPLDKSFSSSYSSCLTRPLVEILRDLHKKIPRNIVESSAQDHSQSSTVISWYHANRMLSFYAPGWCGEVRDVIMTDNGSVTVVYRVTIRGTDGEAHREATGTVSSGDGHLDPVAAAEEIAFCKACARFGLGLYLYNEEQM